MPDAARLIRAGAVTEVGEIDCFPDSTLDDDDGPQAARAQVLRNLPLLAEADPAAVDRIAAWYRDGRSEADALDGMRGQASAHLKNFFHRADDATVRALGHATLTAMRAAEDPDACATMADDDVVAIEEALPQARHPIPSLVALVRRQVAAREDMRDGEGEVAKRSPSGRGGMPAAQRPGAAPGSRRGGGRWNAPLRRPRPGCGRCSSTTRRTRSPRSPRCERGFGSSPSPPPQRGEGRGRGART